MLSRLACNKINKKYINKPWRSKSSDTYFRKPSMPVWPNKYFCHRFLELFDRFDTSVQLSEAKYTLIFFTPSANLSYLFNSICSFWLNTSFLKCLSNLEAIYLIRLPIENFYPGFYFYDLPYRLVLCIFVKCNMKSNQRVECQIKNVLVFLQNCTFPLRMSYLGRLNITAKYETIIPTTWNKKTPEILEHSYCCF